MYSELIWNRRTRIFLLAESLMGEDIGSPCNPSSNCTA